MNKFPTFRVSFMVALAPSPRLTGWLVYWPWAAESWWHKFYFRFRYHVTLILRPARWFVARKMWVRTICFFHFTFLAAYAVGFGRELRAGMSLITAHLLYGLFSAHVHILVVYLLLFILYSWHFVYLISLSAPTNRTHIYVVIFPCNFFGTTGWMSSSTP